YVFFVSPILPAVRHALSLHDALPISEARSYIFCWNLSRASRVCIRLMFAIVCTGGIGTSYLKVFREEEKGRQIFFHEATDDGNRSEEHTSELQSPYDLVCRLLLEKKK